MTTAFEDDQDMSEPLQSSIDHGTAICKVVVGKLPQQRTFAIHKNLLTKTSPYFDRALNGPFAESTGEGNLKLEHHCPIAFEALYQWIYTGRMLKYDEIPGMPAYMRQEYYGTFFDGDLYNLRLFKLTDETMVSQLKIFAYRNLVHVELGSRMTIPQVMVLDELFDSDRPQPFQVEYFVASAAYGLVKEKARPVGTLWQETLDRHPDFGRMILDLLITKGAGPELTHPSLDPRFITPGFFYEYSAADYRPRNS